jgi:structure-specific endonuclease subunit SLX1
MAIGTAIAAGTVSTTYGFILNFLLPSLREELGLLIGFQSEQEKLQSLFTTIQSVLEDALSRQLSDRSLQDWLEKLTEVACHAEDVLDEFNFEALRRGKTSQKAHLRGVRDFFSSNNQLKFRFLMVHKIENLRGKIDFFAVEVSKFNHGPAASQRPAGATDERLTHSFVESTEVIGRNDEKEKVKAALLDARATSRNTSVVAIVGIGGVGKTTLAKLVYNDFSKVNGYFDLKIWICVSDNFVPSQILKSIIKSARPDGKCEVDELDQLQSKVRETLYRKRYLLVLDNVWNEKQTKWNDLEELLRSGFQGSKVMVTTRSLIVPEIMGSCSSHIFRLSPLPDNICWDLFLRRAFEAQETPSRDLVKIGKEIVKKCRGIPLAAQALGSLLRLKRDVADWKSIEKSEMWELFKSADDIMPVLRLSYDHLSSQAKLCFAFCSLFPKDYEMEKETLIRQWICNRFVLNERDPGGGHEVFNHLMLRSFFLETDKDEDGQVRKCKLHDLMHDLARLVAGKHFCMVTKDISGGIVNERTYHLLIDQWSSGLAMILEGKKGKYLRTLLISRCNPIEGSFLKRTFVKMRCLRVLDLSSTEIKVIPNSVGCLIHLRYLDLSNSLIELLPKSVGHLLNLQVLKLPNTKIKKLPESLRKLQSLIHLDIRGCLYLTDMPVGVERLTHLQTLTDFSVGAKKTSCALQELKELDQISGELFIWHLENLKTRSTKIQQTILSNKENLVSLRLTWDHHNNSASNDDIVGALNFLRPHENLKRLQLHNYSGLEFPPWLSESLLPNLVEIKLFYCTNCEHCHHLEVFQILKFSR